MIEDYKYSNYRSLYYTIIDHYRSILAVIVTIYDLVTSSDYITITMIVTYVYIFLVTIGSYHCYSYIVLSICHIYIYINNVPVIYRNYLFLAQVWPWRNLRRWPWAWRWPWKVRNDRIFHKRIGTSRGVEPEIWPES